MDIKSSKKGTSKCVIPTLLQVVKFVKRAEWFGMPKTLTHNKNAHWKVMIREKF
jgi:hypothetical protein